LDRGTAFNHILIYVR